MSPIKDFLDAFERLEDKYIAARVEHSVTAQRCWKLRAQLDQMGITPEREKELNARFGREMERIAQ